MGTSTADNVYATCVAYGSGAISLDEAVERLRPAYREALDERANRNPADPDSASTPNAFVEVSVSRQMGIITMEQYAALAEALTGTA